MLDQTALGQLKALKQSLHDSQERIQGSVRNTHGRHGFLMAKKGRQVLIPAEEMNRVFPGDEISVLVQQDEKGRDYAVVEKLVHSELDRFFGLIVKKGNNIFVLPDLPHLSRWLFIPPPKSNGAREGDYVECAIARHPIKNGKPQAKVLTVVGNSQDPGIERKYVLQKHQLADTDSAMAPTDSEAARCEAILQQEQARRKDLNDIPFITIDGERSRDLDDALHVSKLEKGWLLRVAIADPDAFIETGSKLDELAASRGTSVYLCNGTLSMLPDLLAHHYCSLLPGEKRLALVCELQINEDGSVAGMQLSEACISSQHRLSYVNASELLCNSDDSSELTQQLRELSALRKALYRKRQAEALVMEEKPDYLIHAGSDGKITAIERLERSEAHRIVEECMLAVNRNVALWASANALPIPYISHAGFRTDKHGAIKKLLALTYPEFQPGSLHSLDNYKALIRHVAGNPCVEPVYDILHQMLDRSRTTTDPAPHMGLGYNVYTTFTSPIRKYHDLLVHRIVKATLNDSPLTTISKEQCDRLQQQAGSARLAARALERWLKCQYMAQFVGQQYKVRVIQINPRNLLVRIDELDIAGLLDQKQLGKKLHYNPELNQLKADQLIYRLGDSLDVTLLGVDLQQKIIQFAPCHGQ